MLRRRLLAPLLATVLLVVWNPATADVAVTSVVAVDLPEVEVAAGSRDGLEVGTRAKILRPGQTIVHPLTGEDLGTPQEPVGFMKIIRVRPDRATGSLLKAYTEPRQGDIVEYETAAVEGGEGIPEPPAEAVPEPPAAKEILPTAGPPKKTALEERIEELARRVDRNQRAIEEVRGRPVVPLNFMDEISLMKSLLSRSEGRLGALEKKLNEQAGTLEMLQSEDYAPGRRVPVNPPFDLEINLGLKGETLRFAVANEDTFGLVERTGKEKRADIDDDILITWVLLGVIIVWLSAASLLYLRYRRFTGVRASGSSSTDRNTSPENMAGGMTDRGGEE